MALSLPSFGSLFAGAGRSLRRFPLPVACAFFLTMIVFAKTHDLLGFVAAEQVSRLMVALTLAFFAALAAMLFGEARFWPAWSGQLLGAAAVVLLLALAFAGPVRPIWEFWALHWPSFVGPALVLIAMAAPALGGAWDDARFWDFNRTAWPAAAYAWLAALILALGLQATAYALQALIEIRLGPRITQDFWTLSFGLFWPWLALAGLPRRDEVALEGPPNWLRFLVHWLLVPLVIVYLAVLYAYIVKILIQWQLPEGEVGWVVSTYAAVGVAVHLISAPWRHEGAAHIRFFQRWFYPALFAPIAVLAIAAYLRIQEYGVTEPRYLLVLITAWLFILALFFSFGVRRLILVPLSLALLLFAAAFGPWSAGEVAARSQITRLETALTDAGLLRDGKLSPAVGRIDFETSKTISAGIEHFLTHGRRELIAPWFTALSVDALDEAKYAADLLDSLGVRYVRDWETEPAFSFSLPAQEDLDVEGFQLLSQANLWSNTERTLTAAEGDYHLSYAKATKTLTVHDGKGHIVTFDFTELANDLLKQGLSNRVSEAERSLMTHEASDGFLRVRLMIEQLSGREGPKGTEISSVQVQILIGRAASAAP
jgi:hypothetical protein